MANQHTYHSAEAWQRERAHLAELAQELLARYPITDVGVLTAALTQAHLRGQQFALEATREAMLASVPAFRAPIILAT